MRLAILRPIVAGIVLGIGTLMAADPGTTLPIRKALTQLSTLTIPKTETEIYDPFARPKPVTPVIAPVVQPTHHKLPTLSAIVNQKAFMDGRWVEAGDTLGIFRILAIGDDTVQVADGSRVHTLTFRRYDAVQTVTCTPPTQDANTTVWSPPSTTTTSLP